MVATMSNAAFVLGQTNVDPKDVTSAEWVTILNEAKGHLTLGHLRGLKSLRQLLEEEHGFTRRVKPYVICNNLPEHFRPDALYCHLADIVSAPCGKDSFTFDEIPCKEFPFLNDKVPRPFAQKMLLLSRRSQFCLLQAEWSLEEKAVDVGRTFRNIYRWCELQKISLMLLDSEELVRVFGEYPKTPMRALHRCLLVQTETNMELESRAEWGKRQTEKIVAMLNRLGVPL